MASFTATGIASYGGGQYGQGIGPINLVNVACRGTETSLFSCTYDRNTAGCTHAEDAGVRCHSRKCVFVLSLQIFCAIPPTCLHNI